MTAEVQQPVKRDHVAGETAGIDQARRVVDECHERRSTSELKRSTSELKRSTSELKRSTSELKRSTSEPENAKSLRSKVYAGNPQCPNVPMSHPLRGGGQGHRSLRPRRRRVGAAPGLAPMRKSEFAYRCAPVGADKAAWVDPPLRSLPRNLVRPLLAPGVEAALAGDVQPGTRGAGSWLPTMLRGGGGSP